MTPLNFTRQLRIAASDKDDPTSLTELVLSEGREWAGVAGKRLTETLDRAHVFGLSDGGIVIEDPDLKAISGLDVRLPFETISLEYFDGGGSKTVLLAKEVTTPNLNGYEPDAVEVIVVKDYGESWIVHSFSLFPLDRDNLWSYFQNHSEQEGFFVIFGLVNALSCSNTSIVKAFGKTPKKKRGKPAYPFDDYHWLVLDHDRAGDGASGTKSGSHRSPREHVRRGHIRRYRDGKCIWVNSTIVAAGSGGKITKDYVVA